MILTQLRMKERSFKYIRNMYKKSTIGVLLNHAKTWLAFWNIFLLLNFSLLNEKIWRKMTNFVVAVMIETRTEYIWNQHLKY